MKAISSERGTERGEGRLNSESQLSISVLLSVWFGGGNGGDVFVSCLGLPLPQASCVPPSSAVRGK